MGDTEIVRRQNMDLTERVKFFLIFYLCLFF